MGIFWHLCSLAWVEVLGHKACMAGFVRAQACVSVEQLGLLSICWSKHGLVYVWKAGEFVTESEGMAGKAVGVDTMPLVTALCPFGGPRRGALPPAALRAHCYATPHQTLY